MYRNKFNKIVEYGQEADYWKITVKQTIKTHEIRAEKTP